MSCNVATLERGAGQSRKNQTVRAHTFISSLTTAGERASTVPWTSRIARFFLAGRAADPPGSASKRPTTTDDGRETIFVSQLMHEESRAELLDGASGPPLYQQTMRCKYAAPCLRPRVAPKLGRNGARRFAPYAERAETRLSFTGNT